MKLPIKQSQCDYLGMDMRAGRGNIHKNVLGQIGFGAYMELVGNMVGSDLAGVRWLGPPIQTRPFAQPLADQLHRNKTQRIP